MENPSASEIEHGLSQFGGSEEYHRLSPLHGKLVATDGVAWLAEKADAYWLVDAIAAWQPTAQKDEMLRNFQLWTLTKNRADHQHPQGARLTCWRDTDNEAFHRDMEFTDFPLDGIRLYACSGEYGGRPVIILMLTGEY